MGRMGCRSQEVKELKVKVRWDGSSAVVNVVSIAWMVDFVND